MKRYLGLAIVVAMALSAGASAQPAVAPKLSLTRLDCGSIQVSDFDVFSDTYLYPGKPKKLTASCYLIRHGDRALLWDSGVDGGLVGKPAATQWVFTISLKERVVDQLARLGLTPAAINFVGISHYHDDHTGQAADFPGATLLVGTGDWDAIKAQPAIARRFTPWISGGAKVEPVARDKDVFGDQSVMILDMPGHTPGHKALLVRLKSGPVLLTGDLYHATEQVANRGVPSFNTNRADTLASFDRFQAIAKSLGAKVIIQHEAADIAKLPAFPGGGAMKALLSHASGGPETLTVEELPDPIAGPGQLLVRVRAAAINYPDVLIIEDKYQFKPPRPFAPGGEIAGEVEAVGEGVEGWNVGDRLIAVPGWGGLTEKIVVDAKAAFRLPDHRSFTDGAALLLTYATSIHALYDRGALKAGETLLVLGAAGGVGLAAVELGKARGARVIAAVSSEDKAQAARDAGADDAIVYGRGPFDKDGSKALATMFKNAVGPAGADVIYDPVGGDYAEPALRSIAWEGRYLVVGFPAGIPKLPLNLTLLKSCDVRGVFWGAFAARDPKANAAHVETLFRLWDEGSISPRVSATYPLERGGEAIAALAARSVIGKVVVEL